MGIEKILFHAAKDASFRQALLANRAGAIAAAGLTLRESELAVLRTVPDEALAAMIDRLVVENPQRRRFMGLVAAVATSLAAGTAGMGCDEVETRQYNADAGGCDADCDVDSDSDTDEDAGPDAGPDAGDTDSD